MDNKTQLAYHFISPSFTTSFDNLQTGIGQTLRVTGKLELCKNGLHASKDPFNALLYAKEDQTTLCLVELSERVIGDETKLCARKRKIIKAFDATELLKKFAIEYAESVLPILEKLHPEDKKPREAIEAAKVYLENPTEDNLKLLLKTRNAVYYTREEAYSSYSASCSGFVTDIKADAIEAVNAVYYVVWGTVEPNPNSIISAVNAANNATARNVTKTITEYASTTQKLRARLRARFSELIEEEFNKIKE